MVVEGTGEDVKGRSIEGLVSRGSSHQDSVTIVLCYFLRYRPTDKTTLRKTFSPILRCTDSGSAKCNLTKNFPETVKNVNIGK